MKKRMQALIPFSGKELERRPHYNSLNEHLDRKINSILHSLTELTPETEQ